jgi:alpha-methylacyl-CoA racemase
MPAGPLDGVRVLDLSRLLPGGFCSLLLADFGAQVTKVEDTRAGDYVRWAPPAFEGAEDSAKGALFVALNRGKRSVRLDLKTQGGREALLRLARDHDVLLESFRPGVLDRLGVGWERLREVNPGLVYCAITGYGLTGPNVARSGHDLNYLGLNGVLALSGEGDGPPVQAGAQIADLGGGALMAAFGILAALRHRDATGLGQHIDLSLLDVQVASMINVAQAYLSAGVVGQRNGNEHPSVVPSQSFPCQDGSIMLAAANDGQFARLCAALGLPGLAQEARFRTNDARVHNREALNGLLNERFGQKPVAHWTRVMVEAGLPCGPINDVAQAFADAQVQARGMRIEVDHPAAGALPLLASPIRLSGSPVEYRRAPPLLGQHTDEVLAGLLGMDPHAIAALRAAQVI